MRVLSNPSFAARSIESEKIFEESLAKLRQEANVNETLLIGGGVNIPVGPFTASIEILRTDSLTNTDLIGLELPVIQRQS